MKLGLVLPMFVRDADRVTGFAREAESLGFDGVFAFDHLMPLGGPNDGPVFESFSTLAAVAAATDRISIGTLVARASLRPAGMLAKLAASVDAMSHGRLIVAIGAGDELSRREHDAFGIPYLDGAERRRQLEEVVGAVSALFGGRAWPGGGSVPPVAGPLLPAGREGGPPVWIGGRSEAAARTAAALADGWNGWGLPEETFARRASTLRAAAAAQGRTVEATWGGVVLAGADDAEADALVRGRRAGGRDLPAGAWVGGVAALVARLGALAAAGATWAILLASGPRDRPALIAERIAPALRERT